MWRQLSRFPGHIVPQLRELGLEQEKTRWCRAGGGPRNFELSNSRQQQLLRRSGCEMSAGGLSQVLPGEEAIGPHAGGLPGEGTGASCVLPGTCCLQPSPTSTGGLPLAPAGRSGRDSAGVPAGQLQPCWGPASGKCSPSPNPMWDALALGIPPLPWGPWGALCLDASHTVCRWLCVRARMPLGSREAWGGGGVHCSEAVGNLGRVQGERLEV